jgi:plasmid maintenance system antidote protein VapI
LTYALNNGSTKEQYYKQIFDAFANAQSEGLSDAQIEIGMNQYGISADDLAQATGVTPESVQTRMDVATPTTAEDLAYERAAQEELATRQAQEDSRLASLTAPVETPVTAPVTVPTGLLETPITTPVATPMVAPVTAPVSLLETQLTAPVVTAPVTTGSNMATSLALNYALNNGMTQAQFDKNIFDAVVAAQKNNTSPALLRIEMDRLGITSEDVARATGVTTQSVQDIYNTAVPTTQAELTAKAAADADLLARQRQDAARLATVVTPPAVVTPPVVTPPVVVPPTVMPATFDPAKIAQPNITAGQMRELFPSFAESKRLAGEMVANRPSTSSIINMIQGGSLNPTTRPTATVTAPTELMDAWSAAEKSGNYGDVANMLKGLNVNDLRNYGASAADIAYITSRPQIAGMFPTTATPSLNNVLSMISK